MNKYKLLKDDFIMNGSIKLYRIKSVKDFGNVKVGDLGGYIEKESNLSHKDNAWVSDDARIYGNAEVFENAEVYGTAKIYGNVRIYGNARVYGNARIYDTAKIYGTVRIYDTAKIYGTARIYGNAKIYDTARIYGNAEVFENVRIYGNARVYDDARIYGNAEVFANARVYGECYLKYGNTNFDIMTNLKKLIMNSINYVPSHKNKKGEDIYKLYKRVNETSPGLYSSIYNKDYLYKDNEIKSEIIDTNDKLVSCSKGLHISEPSYWHKGDTLIEVLVNKKDIYTCMAGKIRTNKLKVIGKVTI